MMSFYPTDVPVAAEMSRAARGIRWRGDAWVMAYHPVTRINPFQALLYCRARQSGFAPVAVVQAKDLLAVTAASPFGVQAAIHLHWTYSVIAEVSGAREADTRVGGFLDQLGRLREQGVRIIWTIHNRLPHRCEYPEVETRLRQGLVELADIIHVMAPETPAMVQDLYPLPESRLLRVPHPSYVGAYPTHHSRETVRFELGFEPDDFVVGMVGSVHPYKGVDELVTAVTERGPLHPRLRTLIAGAAGSDPASVELWDRLRRAHDIVSIPKRLDDQNVARLVSALDVMALPYRATLNSGAAMLALSFGVPVVAPRIGHFRTLADRGYCLAYDASDPTGLVDALRHAPDWVRGIDREKIERDMADVSGPLVSERFFTGVRHLLRPAHDPADRRAVAP
jgi:glycosyltransferase involved in cell wall biosynthesis